MNQFSRLKWRLEGLAPLCLLVLFGALAPLSAQELDLKTIMQDRYWIGELPESLTITPDGKTVHLSVTQPLPHPAKRLMIQLADGKVVPVTREALSEALVSENFFHKDLRVAEIEGDLWSSHGDAALAPMIARDEWVRFVRFTPDGKIVFREGNDLFQFDPGQGRLVQLTSLQMSDEPKPADSWYHAEERRMLTEVDKRYVAEEAAKADAEIRRGAGGYAKPKPLYLGPDHRIGRKHVSEHDRHMLDISADLRFVAIALEPENEGDPTQYAEFINEEAEVQAKNARPRVGHQTPTWKLAIWDRQEDKLSWLDISDLPEIETDRLAEIKDKISEEDRKYLPATPEGPRSVYFVPSGFHPSDSHYLVTVFSRDWKDKWVLKVDPATMNKEVVYHQYDPAWIQFFMRNEGLDAWVGGAANWVPDGSRISWLSDETEFQHLYTYDLASKQTKPVTKGDFEVFNPFVGPENKYWYFHANREHPGELHFYRMPTKGGKMQKLTNGVGHHRVALAHDGTMVELFAQSNAPNQVRVRRGKRWETLYDGRSEAFKAKSWVKPRVVTYKNRDGKEVYARLYVPENPNGAGVVFVHGAGYLQNAHFGWSGYFREYMFHNLLMREGYTVLDPDYTASAGYGRDWRTGIYRHMGGRDLNDVIDGAKFLVEKHGISADRLGVYGGSYGGFIALMAMFDQPDVFQAGAALRPVTDWAYYHHWYTSRILNTPRLDPEAYRRSSPIYFAEGLKGHLLICHGMVDDNVHYQDSVRLAQKLIELGKKNWELSSYPVEPHTFQTPSGWYDEYRRIHELFQRTLK
ncbi:S9 family peptidase [Sulfidibacter corallicola]|uniref:S9 family peptidase n=1 Tax=Sulfidibacter corallicola TaxID=2818388 RepID=A0A8A4TG15_SULCO|nr:prolyl oligopeptidase family serine peptidase [Sulfidibacter corallicola]QTD47711.1 S9 family peptidase [Sulfidibacter corallicola]